MFISPPISFDISREMSTTTVVFPEHFPRFSGAIPTPLDTPLHPLRPCQDLHRLHRQTQTAARHVDLCHADLDDVANRHDVGWVFHKPI